MVSNKLSTLFAFTVITQRHDIYFLDEHKNTQGKRKTLKRF